MQGLLARVSIVAVDQSLCLYSHKSLYIQLYILYTQTGLSLPPVIKSRVVYSTGWIWGLGLRVYKMGTGVVSVLRRGLGGGMAVSTRSASFNYLGAGAVITEALRLMTRITALY